MTDTPTRLCTTPVCEARLCDMVQELERRGLAASWSATGNIDGRTLRKMVADDDMPADTEEEAIDLMKREIAHRMIQNVIDTQDPNEAVLGCGSTPIEGEDMAPGSCRVSVSMIALNLEGLRAFRQDLDDEGLAGKPGAPLQ